MTWEIFKKAFLDGFFPRRRGNPNWWSLSTFIKEVCVLEYSLIFIKLSKYAPSLVSVPRDEMSSFVMGVSNDLQEECYSVMLHDNMNISRLMVHAQQVEEIREKRKSRDVKRQRRLMVVLQRAGLISKTSLGSRRGFLTKFLPSSLRLLMIGCLTLSLKKEEVLVYQIKSLLVPSVEKVI